MNIARNGYDDLLVRAALFFPVSPSSIRWSKSRGSLVMLCTEHFVPNIETGVAGALPDAVVVVQWL